MNIRFIYLNREYKLIKKEISKKMLNVIENGIYILGEEVKKIEKRVAEYCRVKYAVGVNSGTDALFLSLKALGIGRGDVVITTPFTFVATANAIINAGAEPYFIDIDERTFNIDPSKIEKALKKDKELREKAKAIIPVHLYGQMAEMDYIKEIAENYGLLVIEDVAQAFGAKYNSKEAGYYSDCACFSFFPTKNLSCFGDGGMMITNNNEIYEKVKILRVQGQKRKYFCEINGFNSRLDEIQASVLNVKIKYIGKFIENRRKNAEIYNEHLSEYVIVPYTSKKAYHTFNIYTIKCEKRNELQKFLRQNGIETQIYYPYPLHKQKCFEKFNRKSLQISEKISKEVLSLPIYFLKTEEVEYATNKIKKFYK